MALVVAVTLVVAAGVGSGSAAPTSAPPAPTFEGAKFDERNRQLDAERKKRDDARSTPEARKERAESRHKYAGQRRDDAAALARKKFPDALMARVLDGAHPLPGHRVAKFISANAAVALDSKDRRTVVASLAPLAVQRDKKWDAIDLSMHRDGGDFVPSSPAVPVRIADKVAQGVAFPSGGFAFHVVGASADEAATLQDDRAFFANTATDTDVAVVPQATGVETFFQVRSADAPERFELGFVLPAGVRLQMVDLTGTDADAGAGDPMRVIAFVRGHDRIGYVSLANTTDADGQPVETSTSLDGDKVVVAVRHHGADVQYPLLVDPTVWQDYRWGGVAPDGSYTDGALSGMTGWTAGANVAGKFVTMQGATPAGPGLFIGAPANVAFATGNFADWYWTAPPKTYVTRAEFQGVSHGPVRTQLQETLYGGPNYAFYDKDAVWAPPNSNYLPEPFAATGALTNDYKIHCYTTPCEGMKSINDGNQVLLLLKTTETNTKPSTGWAYMNGIMIGLRDRYAPTASLAGAVDPGWHDDGGDLVARKAVIHDDGLGIFSFSLSGVAWGGGPVFVGCDGDIYKSICPKDLGPGDLTYGLSEGTNTVTLTATDASDNVSQPFQWTENIDRSAPVLATLTGTLADQVNKTVRDGETYTLHMDATDGTLASNATKGSGVVKLQLEVDGEVEHTWTQSCPDSSCPMTKDWDFHPERYANGWHWIRVTAFDGADHASSQKGTWSYVMHAASSSVGPGAVNLLTGNFAMSREDVSIDSYASDLTVGRVYNSRDSTAGTDGPFGAGWLPAFPTIGSDSEFVQIEQTTLNADGTPDTQNPNGASVLTLTSGEQASFGQNPDLAKKPIGFEDLSLAYKSEDDTFSVTDLEGNKTVFGKVGTGNGLYKPKQVSQAANASTSTFSYDDSARVSRILAPVAQGVTCSTMSAGCRALTFTYASDSTSPPASGSFGDFAKRLKEVDFVAGTHAPVAVAQYDYDSDGHLHSVWDPRISPALKETYGYDSGGHLKTITPAGLQPWTVTYAAISGDSNTGRLKSVSRTDPAIGQPATETLVYDVPLSGSGAPYSMTSGNVAAWGQSDVPTLATAIFPPDQIPADPPTSYSRATVHYLDGSGHEVNTAEPGGHIDVTEYDAHDNAVRELSATNRERALAAGGSSASQAALLDTHRRFSSDGLDMEEQWGPQHPVKLNDGSTVSARSHTVVTYDTHLPRFSTTSALVGGVDRDARVTETAWDTTLKKPTSVTEDVGGQNLKTTTLYDPTNGLESERRLPGGALGGDAHTTRTIYYTAGTNAADAACSNKPEWANLVCKTLPAAQPTTAGLPKLPVTTYTYNDLNQPLTATEDVSGVTRTTTTTYDAAGRETLESVASSVGSALADVTTTYKADTGLLAITKTPFLTISRAYDTLGRLVDYTDASNNHTTTSFDLLGRPVTVNDGKGNQTYSYDATTGLLTGLQDSGAGAFSATYDADDALVTQTYPNGLKATSTYDEAGQRTGLTYVKTTSCSSNCTWLSFSAMHNVFGEIAGQDGTLSKQAYSYDGAGRLTSVQDSPAGQGCVVRDYKFDADSNRTRLTTHAPKADNSCDPTSTGTSVAHTYDDADRVFGTGYGYDTFGRITSVPAADANGGMLTAAYFTNDRAQSITQDGITHTYGLDPLRRVRVDLLTGGDGQTRAARYPDDSDSPAWTTESSDGFHWSRNVEGIGGDLAAIYDNQTGTALQLTNLHGDVVATASPSDTATAPTSTFEADEFGIPRQTTSPRYSWLGGKQRPTKLNSGLIQMGVRSYLPSLGRFLQTDPVQGGSANAYDYANQDPVNTFDLDGKCAGPLRILMPVCKKVVKKVGKKVGKFVKKHWPPVKKRAKKTACWIGIALACASGSEHTKDIPHPRRPKPLHVDSRRRPPGIPGGKK